MSDIPAPPGMSYLPYQLKAIKFAMGARGTILADEMGLGKTVEAIGVINATANPGTLNVLIIAPAFLVRNWWTEIDRWLVVSCRLSVASYYQSIHIANELEDGTNPGPIDILIVDEAHYIKNPETQRAQVIEAIAKHAKRVLLITGTPMDGAPIELWQLLKVACPEKWCVNPRIETPSYVLMPERKNSHPGEGPAFWAYVEKYCNLQYKEYTIETRDGPVTRKALDFGGSSNTDELAKRLRATCMVRRLKKDVLKDLPAKRRQLIVLDTALMGTSDDDLFPELSDETYYDVLKQLRTDRVAFTEWSTRRHAQALAKVDTCLRFIGDALDGSHKIIVFGYHTDVIEKLHTCLKMELPHDHEYVVGMTGSTPMVDRQKAVNAFQTDPDCRIIVGSIGVLGVGWTLTAASHVIFCELDPRPSWLNQAEDRPHRVGQRDSVLIQHLVTNGSLCARMAQIAVRKQAVTHAVLDSLGSVAETELEGRSFFHENGEG